jgi:hypothetical protein
VAIGVVIRLNQAPFIMAILRFLLQEQIPGSSCMYQRLASEQVFANAFLLLVSDVLYAEQDPTTNLRTENPSVRTQSSRCTFFS